MSTVTVDIKDSIATITFNRPRSLNAITRADYDAFSDALRSINNREDVVVTVWQATGSWFCAGTDVNMSLDDAEESPSVRKNFLHTVAPTSTDVGHALATHDKILVAALNGPVLGIAATFLGHFDFIYCMPNAWLATPFSFLGIIAEAGSSASFVNRMGLGAAQEVLLWGKKKTAEDLLRLGFVNEILPAQSVPEFHASIRAIVLRELDGLDPAALLVSKKLIKDSLNERGNILSAIFRESIAQATRFASGVPSQRFAAIARKEIKHKL